MIETNEPEARAEYCMCEPNPGERYGLGVDATGELAFICLRCGNPIVLEEVDHDQN